MRVLALIIAWLVFMVAGGITVSLALTVRSVRRALRVAPDHPTAAPIGWLWSLRAPARLHRRLKRAVRLARASVAPLAPAGRTWRRPADTGWLTRLAEELAQRAAFVDDRLVSAAMARWLLPDLSREVSQIEWDARRLAGVAAAWRAQLQRAQLAAHPELALDMRSRLDAFEAAMAELSRVGSTG